MQPPDGDILPTLHVSHNCGFDVVACALPKMRQIRAGLSDLNTSQSCVAGFGAISDKEGKSFFVSDSVCAERFTLRRVSTGIHILRESARKSMLWQPRACTPRRSCNLPRTPAKLTKSSKSV